MYWPVNGFLNDHYPEGLIYIEEREFGNFTYLRKWKTKVSPKRLLNETDFELIDE